MMALYDFYNDCWKWFLLPTFEVKQVYLNTICKYYPKSMP